MSNIYQGPVIDPHHHLWDLSMQRHPWLVSNKQAVKPEDEMVFGSVEPIRRDYLPDDYKRDTQGQNIVATVHIEAGWDERYLDQETQWLDDLDKGECIARRYVARVSLLDCEAEQKIAEQATNERVVGVRDIVSWHPVSGKSFAAEGLMSNIKWRKGLSALARHELSFDLMLYPWQMAEAERLLHDYPELTFILNHCGSPADRTRQGLQQWRNGLKRLSHFENLSIKISNPVAYDPQWTMTSLADVIHHCIDCFGPERAMFGSDFPVAGLHASFADLYAAYRKIAATYSSYEQSLLFFETANRIYRLNLEFESFNKGSINV